MKHKSDFRSNREITLTIRTRNLSDAIPTKGLSANRIFMWLWRKGPPENCLLENTDRRRVSLNVLS